MGEEKSRRRRRGGERWKVAELDQVMTIGETASRITRHTRTQSLQRFTKSVGVHFGNINCKTMVECSNTASSNQ